MDLNSGRLITRARVTLIPITENVIKAVNAMSEDQGIKGLKITNKRGIIYHPADRFAGVDHDPNIDPDYEEELDEEGIEVSGRDIEYKPQMASLIARLIVNINTKATNDEIAFTQQFILKKGLKEFGNAGYEAALKAHVLHHSQLRN